MAHSVYRDALDRSFSIRTTSSNKWLQTCTMFWTLIYAVLGTLILLLHNKERAFYCNLKAQVKAGYITLRCLINAILAIATTILALVEKASADGTAEFTTQFTTKFSTEATTEFSTDATTKRYDPSGGRRKREASASASASNIAYVIASILGVVTILALIYMMVQCAIIWLTTRCAILYMSRSRCQGPGLPRDERMKLHDAQEPLEASRGLPASTQGQMDQKGNQDEWRKQADSAEGPL